MENVKQRKLWLRYEALAMLSAWDRRNPDAFTPEDSILINAMCDKVEKKWMKEFYSKLPLNIQVGEQLDTNKDTAIHLFRVVLTDAEGKPSIRAGLDVSQCSTLPNTMRIYNAA